MTAKGAGTWLVIAVLSIGAAGCSSSGAPAPVGERSERPAWRPHSHEVKKGDTLYSVAWSYGYDYRELARWNAIKPPYTIYPGQRLRLRPVSTSATTRPAERRRTPNGSGAASVSRAGSPDATKTNSKPASKPRDPPTKASSMTPDTLEWQWPTEGELLRTFSPKDSGRKGVDIGGRLGQSIHAAASGRVVYSGSGLIGYGQLIIIKHDKDYLSAYAHNRKLLVNEDEEVRVGQPIAEMGDTGADRAMLHFEIRRAGKPVDPIPYLPKR